MRGSGAPEARNMPAKTRNRLEPTRIAAALLSVLLAAAGCGPSDEQAENYGPEAFVTLPPLAFLARQIAGEHVRISVLVRPGANPHTYAATPKQIIELNRGGLLLHAGTAFEQTLASRLTRDNDKLTATSVAQGIAHSKAESDHDHDHDHHHDEHDQHIWMSPKIAKALTIGICRELSGLDPEHADEFRDNAARLEADLDKLHTELAGSLAPLKGREFFVFHPAFGHFADEYGLKQVAVETHGKSPGAKHLTDLIARAKASETKVIFAQPQFSQNAAEAIAREIGGQVVLLDPLSDDYMNNLRRIAAELRKALQP